ncbi:MAG TPA: PhzF family phenazine biosynthesis protein [candidate division Zixibacteria bacterium]|nr:PhzF family phenazine biosynthesis protein [candidate division Zixibacteria bacterium]
MQKIYTVDSFTRRPFAGNPAGVCPLAAPAPEDWMRRVASEMNLSETAFFYPAGDGYDLRWFTPVAEVDLCGHATLAAAHILWSERLSAADRLVFSTRSGKLGATRDGDLIELDLPAAPVNPCDTPEGLLEALGVEALYVGRYGPGAQGDFLIEVTDREALLALNPDFTALKRIPARGILITASGAGSDYDFFSRFFAPAFGIDEDPVTGSAHCASGPYWAKKFARSDLRAFQDSRRGGEVELTVAGERVALRGAAVTIMRGEIIAPDQSGL